MNYRIVLASLALMFIVASASAVTYTNVSVPAVSYPWTNSTTTAGATFESFLATAIYGNNAGGASTSGWTSSAATNQRFNIDFGPGNATIIRRVYYENYHNSGALTNRGAKNFIMQGSNTASSLNVTYADNTGWDTLVTTTTQFNQHNTVDGSDPQNFTISNSVAYRNYSFKIADGWGDGSLMGLRRVVLQTEDGYIPLPIATFTGNNMSIAISNTSTEVIGYVPFTMQFSNTTTIAANITSFVWNATPSSTGLPFTFNSTSAFPQYKFVNPDNYFINLNVSGTGGSNISTQVFWVNLTTSPQIVANFTANQTSLVYPPPAAVQFTDQSTFYPSGWLWDFGDGTTSTQQNPIHSYSSVGLKNVTLTSYLIENTTNTNTLTKVDYINVTYNTTYVGVDFSGTPTAGSPGVLVQFTDLTVFGNATTTGRIYNWSFGDPLSTTPYSSLQNPQHVYPYAGTYSVTLTVNNTADLSLGSGSEMKANYIIVSTEQNQKLNVLYPHEVRLIAVDVYGNRLRNVSVSSVMINSTTDGTNWFSYLYGISGTATPVEGTKVSGFTDTYGSVVFPMLGSGDYQLTFVSAEYGISQIHRLHPEENSYTIVLATSSTVQALNSGDYITQNLSVFESSPNVYLNMSYNDTSLSTTNINFFVDFANRTRVYTKNYPGTATTNQSINTSYAVTNTNGVAYVWGYSAYSTLFGWQNMSQGITLKGPTGMFYNPFEYKGRW